MSEITAQSLRERLESGEQLEVVDIREADEFSSWHIHGSRNVPVYNALRTGQSQALERGAAELPRDRPLVAVCRAGILSMRAAGMLQSLGYDASSLAGGIRGWGAVWSEAPVPFEREDATFVQIRRNGKGCLSYLLGADGEAVVVDPCVNVAAYLGAAKRAGLRITTVLETHVHADHLSRARELCAVNGARLVMPRNERVAYDYEPVDDGARLSVGGIGIEVLATPGHTGESVCYLVDGSVLLTGDTLFAGAVGRPDLEKGDAGAEAGADALYESLHGRLLDGFENLRFYPAHTSDPIGFDREPIGATIADTRSLDLLQLDKPAFIERILASLQAKPPNHQAIISVNEGKVELGPVDPLDLEAGPNRCAAG